MNKQQPLGIFDSGLGGLTVVKEINQCLSSEDVVYLGDTAHVPYGTKSAQAIISFSKQNAEFLKGFDIKALIIACNSASAYAYEELKKNYHIPVINVIEPGAKAAVSQTKNGRIGVIGTSATIASKAYDKAIAREDKNIKIFSCACPLFVPLIEEGWLNEEVTYAVAKKYLSYFKDKNIDTLILGCTHYPLIKDIIKQVMGESVTLIDSASAVVNEIKEVLLSQGVKKEQGKQGKRRFFVSDYTQNFLKISQQFLGDPNIQLELAKME